MLKSHVHQNQFLLVLLTTTVVIMGFPGATSAQENQFQPMVLLDDNPRQDSDRSWISRVHLRDVNEDDATDMISVKESISRTGERRLSFSWTANDNDKVPFAERVEFGPNRVVYREESDLILGSYARDMRSTMADLNGDSLADIIAVHTDSITNAITVSVHYNTGRISPRFLSSQALLTLPITSTAVHFVDMDGDEDLDVIGQTNVRGLNQAVVLLNTGGPTNFGPLSPPLSIGRADSMAQATIAVGDVNGDGLNDVVQSRQKQDYIYLNNGTARPFSASTTPQAVYHDDLASRIIRLKDLDNDGDLDLISIKGRSGQSRYFLNEGADGLFSKAPARVIGIAGARLCTLNVADYNRDGYKDLLTGQCAPGRSPIRLFVNSGNRVPFARLTPGVAGPVLLKIPQLDSADIDNDGDMDFLTLDDGRNMYLNNDFRQTPMPVLRVTTDEAVTEDVGSVYVDVELAEALTSPVRLEFGTRPLSAVNGQDAFKGIFSFVNGANIDKEVVNIKIIEPTGVLPQILVRSARALETAGALNFKVALDRATTQSVSLDIATHPVADGAKPGVDYYGKTETVTFAPGQRQQNFTVEILADSEREGVERFGLNLFNIQGAELAEPGAEIHGYIVDQRPATVRYGEPAHIDIVEGQSARVTLTLDRALDETASVRMITQAVSTASAGKDFREIDTVLRFQPGQKRRTVTVSTIDDRAKETIESFRVYIVDRAQNLRAPDRIWKTIRIIDND